MPTAEQIPVADEPQGDFSSLVSFSPFDGVNSAHRIILDAQCLFADTLSKYGAIALSPDGSHGRALEDIVIYSFTGEHTPDGENLNGGQEIYKIPMGDHIEIYRFVQPEEPENTRLMSRIVSQALKEHLQQEKTDPLQAVTYTHEDTGNITVAIPEGEVPKPAVVSKEFNGKLTQLTLEFADKKLCMLFDEHHVPVETTLADGDVNAARIYGAEAAIDGNGIPWLRIPSQAHDTYNDGCLFVYNPAKNPGEAIVVRLQEPNPLFLTDAFNQRNRMNDILAKLIDEEWLFGSYDGLSMHIAQLNVEPNENHPVGTLPVYFVYRANQANNDERAKNVHATITHDVHMHPGSPGISLDIPGCRGFIFLPTGQHVIYGIQPSPSDWNVATINLHDGKIKKGDNTIVFQPNAPQFLESGREMIGMYLFINDPIISPDGHQVRALLVSNTESTGNKIKKKLGIEK